MSPAPVGSREVWNKGLADEVHFWNQWFSTKGREWPEEYRLRLDPSRPLQYHLGELVDKIPGDEVSILDIGAGPLTTLGKVWKDRKLRIVAVDALADVYDEIMARHSVVPLVRTTWCHGELLTTRFPHDTFDLVWSVNALDHSYDPIEVILQAIDVVKIDHHVRLAHQPNEAEREQYVGLHQWNFCSDNGRFIIWNRQRRIDVTELLSPFATVTSLGKDPAPEILIKKLRPRPTVEGNDWLAEMIGNRLGQARRYYDDLKKRLGR
jgi:SAM-dependent methyltransferase